MKLKTAATFLLSSLLLRCGDFGTGTTRPHYDGPVYSDFGAPLVVEAYIGDDFLAKAWGGTPKWQKVFEKRLPSSPFINDTTHAKWTLAPPPGTKYAESTYMELFEISGGPVYEVVFNYISRNSCDYPVDADSIRSMTEFLLRDMMGIPRNNRDPYSTELFMQDHINENICRLFDAPDNEGDIHIGEVFIQYDPVSLSNFDCSAIRLRAWDEDQPDRLYPPKTYSVRILLPYKLTFSRIAKPGTICSPNQKPSSLQHDPEKSLDQFYQELYAENHQK